MFKSTYFFAPLFSSLPFHIQLALLGSGSFLTFTGRIATIQPEKAAAERVKRAGLEPARGGATVPKALRGDLHRLVAATAAARPDHFLDSGN